MNKYIQICEKYSKNSGSKYFHCLIFALKKDRDLLISIWLRNNETLIGKGMIVISKSFVSHAAGQ